jgi:lipopolysaccharide/colanic/teichoic acid biosynthesis glycosyltransferase
MSCDHPPLIVETRGAHGSVRRTVDLAVLAVAAPFVLALLALLAVVVKLDSPGPVFVRVQRLGRDGRPFGLLKLRSMRHDAEQLKESLQHLNILPWPDFKLAEDPRVTRAGRWLRRYSLDELAQLYNLLRGDMTLIGPRPCSVKLPDYELWQTERLDVTPGLIGRWQADGRGWLDFAGRCRLDIHQAQSRSVRVNLQLVAATVWAVLASRGAY